MNIRNAREADLPAIVEIYNSTIPTRMVTADTDYVTPASKLDWFREHTQEKRPIWVVELENEVVAWLSFSSFKSGRPAYDITAEISIYVAEGHRGKGVGSILLQKAIQSCPGLGIENLVGFIFAHNYPSLRFFNKFSFEQWGYLPGVADLDGIKRDVVILDRRVRFSGLSLWR